MPSLLDREGIAMPSLLNREGMTRPSLSVKSFFKKNAKHPIRTRESRGFPRDIPRAPHSGCPSENPGFLSFLWNALSHGWLALL